MWTYLIFVIFYTGKIFETQIFTPKNCAKQPKITTNTPKKCKICSSSRSIWKILHRTEFFYTGTARGARDKYEVCWGVASQSARETSEIARPGRFSFKTNMSHLEAGNRTEGFYWVEITSRIRCKTMFIVLQRLLRCPVSWLVETSATLLGNVMKH